MIGFCGFGCGYTADQSFTCPQCEATVCYCDGGCEDSEMLSELCCKCRALHTCDDADPERRCAGCAAASDKRSREQDAKVLAEWAENIESSPVFE